jgi:hypothetical protein
MMSSKKAKKIIELHPDAWERFERATGVVAMAPPQHRGTKKKIKPKKKAANLPSRK